LKKPILTLYFSEKFKPKKFNIQKIKIVLLRTSKWKSFYYALISAIL